MVDRLLGLLRVRVLRGVNLAIRDLRSSDPYVILRMGKQRLLFCSCLQKLKTRVIKKNVNPEWDEELTLSVEDPAIPVKLEVYDKDTFSFDDPMGDAEFDIRPFCEVMKMDLKGTDEGAVIRKQVPSRQNCLAEESSIRWMNGRVIQDMVLRLRHVECGEIELQLQWVHIPSAFKS
ncbi:putative ADP-ribosylation factor GTPase-activating protein AGD11 [Apostasia shenzhenica]|uniref:Putative ADP-ribosylation factor GTPase-activating protein AGD11 n=1 Tax=Apostasia shenzhenica TaxID=1088818 RepID=A0A2I0AUC9_9ASPA|nr:putative ADP-ribosylation factor GTPase-activating protein AGD11 [Apostasia shenzhenica]